jgi:hypothetical protein
MNTAAISSKRWKEATGLRGSVLMLSYKQQGRLAEQMVEELIDFAGR